MTHSAATHVDAYVSTGTSPGRRGSVPVSLSLATDRAVEATVGYELLGPAHAPAVVVLGGISANRHLTPTTFDPSPGWFRGVVGPGAALDPARHRLVGADWLGGPRSRTPTASRVTPDDQARALLAVLDELDVRSATFVGASYGGMVALHLAALAPERVTALVLLCAAHRPHPMATALRALQRDVLRLGAELGAERRAVSVARALAMTTYRSEIEFEQRFGHRRLPDGFPVEAYLRARGDAFADAFDADSFLCLSESIDHTDVDPASVRAPTTLVSFDTDRLVPPWLVAELAEGAPGVREHVTVPTRYGHDGFLKEPRTVGRLVSRALRAEVAR